MTEVAHYDTKPEDRIPLTKKIVYGLGAFVNNLLAAKTFVEYFKGLLE